MVQTIALKHKGKDLVFDVKLRETFYSKIISAHLNSKFTKKNLSTYLVFLCNKKFKS